MFLELALGEVDVQIDFKIEVAASLGQRGVNNLYLLNTRAWLNQLSENRGRPLTLKDLTDDEINDLCEGKDAIWLMGIYKPSAISADIARQFGRDVSSPFSIAGYEPSPLIARDWSEWDGFIMRLHKRGVKIILDFVPNHVARDHPWINTHPEYFIHNNDDSIAYGKDPNFPDGWCDTAQLDYSNANLRDEMQRVLLKIAQHADGVRCDMAMLVTPETFQKTWGKIPSAFWPSAIRKVLKLNPDFIFIAESYGGVEELLNDGFNSVYDSEYYENLQKLVGGEISRADFINHLRVMNDHLVAYSENHDEMRAALKFGREKANAIAVITAFTPALWMIHQGQEEGRLKHLDMQVNHFPRSELIDSETREIYEFLFKLRQTELFRSGVWFYPDLIGAENIIAQQVEIVDKIGVIACTNFSDSKSAGFIKLPINAKNIRVFDVVSQSFIKNPSFPERIDNRREGMRLYIDLGPNTSQIVYYDL